MNISNLLPVISKHLKLFSAHAIVCYNKPCVTKCAQILRWIKRNGARRDRRKAPAPEGAFTGNYDPDFSALPSIRAQGSRLAKSGSASAYSW